MAAWQIRCRCPMAACSVIGAIDYQQDQRAALWRCRRDGVLDTSFAAPGLLVAAGLPDSEGLSIHRNADGSLNIAVQATQSEDKIWLEVHDWKTGAEAPQRFSRQAMPVNWVGPASWNGAATPGVWSDAPLAAVGRAAGGGCDHAKVAVEERCGSARSCRAFGTRPRGAQPISGKPAIAARLCSQMNAHAPAWPSAWVVLFIAAVSGATWWLRRA